MWRARLGGLVGALLGVAACLDDAPSRGGGGGARADAVRSSELASARPAGPAADAPRSAPSAEDALASGSRSHGAASLPPAAARPGPARARGEAAVRANAACEGCHPREATEWRASGHRSAFVDAPFQDALAHDDPVFCRSCHAPEADPREVPAPAVGALGVGCVTCHVLEEGAVLAAPAPAGAGAPPAPAAHAIVRSADFAGSGACASCHEFAFPAAPSAADEHLMQTTVREHARAPSADRPCASCHMPEDRGGRRSHAFASVRDPRWLRESVAVTAALEDHGVVTLTLRQTNPGHAMPTGDLFRRLEVGAELRSARGEVLARPARWLARHFEISGAPPGRRLVADDRLFAEPRQVELDLETAGPIPAGATVRWWVTYQRVAQTGSGADPRRVQIESEVPLASGELRGPPAP